MAQKTCLVIEDSSVIRGIVTDIAAELGLRTLECENASEGIELLASETIDAVLLDWDLQRLGALDFLQGMARLPDEKHVAVILCATENNPEQFSLARAAGAAHHILKPFDLGSLAEKFAEAGVIESPVAVSNPADQSKSA